MDFSLVRTHTIERVHQMERFSIYRCVEQQIVTSWSRTPPVVAYARSAVRCGSDLP